MVEQFQFKSPKCMHGQKYLPALNGQEQLSNEEEMKPHGHGKANASESEIDRAIDEVSEVEPVLLAEPEPVTVEKSKKEAMNATTSPRNRGTYHIASYTENQSRPLRRRYRYFGMLLCMRIFY